MNPTSPEERIRNAKIETLLGERGKAADRAVRKAELDAALKEIDRLTTAYDALAKRVTALE